MSFHKRLFTLGLALFLTFSSTACETVKVRGAKKQPKDDTLSPSPTPNGNRGSVQTIGFLVTRDVALKSWLDKEFQVRYLSMTPQLIFDQEPLNEIKFSTHNLPIDAKPFNYNSNAISRRGILKKISEFWNLDMAILTDANGNPTVISVTGR